MKVKMFNYVFVALFCDGSEIEIQKRATSEKKAQAAAMQSLTDEQKDNLESIECVEVLH